ncbi:MAG: protein translocase subunit SecF [Patescibacteria group bacterium]
MFIVKHRKFFYSFSLALIVLSIASFLIWGLKFGIDFKGGSLLEISYTSTPAPSIDEITGAIADSGIVGSSVRPTGETGYLIRTPFLTPTEYDGMKVSLTKGGLWQYDQKRFDSIGPTIGSELQTKSIYALVLVLLAIAFFIMFAFRKVSKPVSSWKYGLVALIALAHDVIIPIGVFSILGHFFGAEVDTLFVTAILVVLGFSVHDTIVVFDRVRENLRKNQEKHVKEVFEETVGKSIAQTLNRSLNTSLTVVLVLVTLLILGPVSVHFFVIALLVGVITGTYSSVFIGSPLLVTLEKMQKPELVSKK